MNTDTIQAVDTRPLTPKQFRALATFAAALEGTASRFRAARTQDDAAAVFKEIDKLVDEEMAMRAEKAGAHV